jgi:hypothetical protein
MKERLPRTAEERERLPPPTPRPDGRAALALRLQGTAGNQAVTRLLQRVDTSDLVEHVREKLSPWHKYVGLNRRLSTPIGLPAEWRVLALDYSKEHPEDGAWIAAGLSRAPLFSSGGPAISSAGSDAHAITLDRDVFFNPNKQGEPSVDTYVHELVHVAQYGLLGVTGFLGTYFADFLRHLAGDAPEFDTDKAYHNIAHEAHAREIEARFKKWRLKREEKEQAEAAKRPKVPTIEEEVEEAKRPRPSVPASGPIALKGSIGARGDNHADDVRAVARRLHTLGFLGAVTADVNAVTEAIESYQREVLRWPKPDGRVDPGGKTHEALNASRKAGVGLQLPG